MIEEFLDVPGTVEQLIPVSVTLGRVKALGGWGREKALSTTASNEDCRLMLCWGSWYRAQSSHVVWREGKGWQQAQNEMTMSVSYWASILWGLQKCETWSKEQQQRC